MLIGEFEHSLDIKGRLILPSKIREDLGEKFILTKGLDGCLFGFSKTEWANFEEKLKTLPLTNKNARDFVRFFLSGATECEMEKKLLLLVLVLELKFGIKTNGKITIVMKTFQQIKLQKI